MRLIWGGAVAIAAMTGFFAACGGTAISGPPGGTDAGGSVDSGHLASPCPATSGGAVGACTIEGLVCEFGTDPRPSCKDRAICNKGTWAQSQVDCSEPDPLHICPATRAEVKQGASCAGVATCEYAEGECDCQNPYYFGGPTPADAGGPTWYCPQAPAANCPAKRPNLGTGCATDNLECVYGGGCSYGAYLRCKDGYWQDEPIACAN